MKFTGFFHLLSYLFDLSVDKAEDVLVHLNLLAKAMEGAKCPVFHCRFMQVPPKLLRSLNLIQ